MKIQIEINTNIEIRLRFIHNQFNTQIVVSFHQRKARSSHSHERGSIGSYTVFQVGGCRALLVLHHYKHILTVSYTHTHIVYPDSLCPVGAVNSHCSNNILFAESC